MLEFCFEQLPRIVAPKGTLSRAVSTLLLATGHILVLDAGQSPLPRPVQKKLWNWLRPELIDSVQSGGRHLLTARKQVNGVK